MEKATHETEWSILFSSPLGQLPTIQKLNTNYILNGSPQYATHYIYCVKPSAAHHTTGRMKFWDSLNLPWQSALMFDIDNGIIGAWSGCAPGGDPL